MAAEYEPIHGRSPTFVILVVLALVKADIPLLDWLFGLTVVLLLDRSPDLPHIRTILAHCALYPPSHPTLCHPRSHRASCGRVSQRVVVLRLLSLYVGALRDMLSLVTTPPSRALSRAGSVQDIEVRLGLREPIRILALPPQSNARTSRRGSPDWYVCRTRIVSIPPSHVLSCFD